MVLALVGDSTMTSALPFRAARAFGCAALVPLAFLAGALAAGAFSAGAFAAGAVFFFVLRCFSRVAIAPSVVAEVTAWSNSGGNKKVALPSRCKAAHSKSFQ